MRISKMSQALAVSCGLLVGGAAFAETTGESSATISQLQDNQAQIQNYWIADSFDQVATLPGFSLGAPSGLTPSWGVMFASGSGMTNAPGTDKFDAAVSGGFGFGDSQKSVGGALSLGLGSIKPDGGQLQRGNIGVSVGHLFAEHLTGVAVGVNNIAGWGAGGGLGRQSYNVAVTKIWANDALPIIGSFGIGNNAYGFAKSTKAKSQRWAPFFSVAGYVHPQASVIVDYTGGAASVGASLVPVAQWPITVNLSAYDVFKYVPQHENVSFAFSAAYAYMF